MPMIPKVDAPTLAPPPHGLVQSANVVTTTGGEWENGVQISPRGCFVINATQITCPPDDLSALQDCTPWETFLPYNLEFGIEWSTADSRDPEADLRAAIEVGTSSKLESLIWEGHASVPENTNLGEFALATTGTPVQALGYAEARLRDSSVGIGSTGTIHMSATVATFLSDHFVQIDGVLLTKVGGNIVVIGDYPSSFIAAHTGAVDVYLGEPELTEAIEELRRYNNQVVRVQRPALAVWNPCNTFRVGVTGVDPA